MKFIHFTDTHIKNVYGDNMVDGILKKLPSPISNLQKVLQDTRWEDISFIVFTGDLIHEGQAEDYATLRDTVAKEVPAHVKVLYALGNHDNKEAFNIAMKGEAKSDSHYYTEHIDGYRMIVLDSAIPNKASGKITTSQLEWLKQELANPSEKGSVVFLHHPIFWNGPAGFEGALADNGTVIEILKNSDVFAVFSGHTHVNAVNICEGIVQYTADSCAFSLEVRKGTELAFTDKSGYILAEINERNIYAHFETITESNAIVSVPLEVMAEQLRKLDEE